MADDTEEYMKTKDDYKGSIIRTLRNPLKSDKDSITITTGQKPKAASPMPEAMKPKKTQMYPGDPVKSAIGEAYDKVLGRKSALDEEE